MKHSIIVALLLIMGLVSCQGTKQDNPVVSDLPATDISDTISPRNPYSSSLFDQYFEILKSFESDGQTLDTIPGMVNLFMTQYWAKPTDSVKFKMKMGVSLDDDYPNELVRKTIFKYLNKYLARGFDYDITSKKQDEIVSKGADASADLDSFLNEWKEIFQKVSSLNGNNKDHSRLPEIVGSGSCTVCHKIYEDDEYATYLIEGVTDYHSSSGDPTKADYVTINKSSGNVLSVNDVRKKYDEDALENLISAAYKQAVEDKGSNYTANYSGSDLLAKADGVAIINEGLLFYYYPYKIGVGAEGQYCLILSIQ